jgi:hypothetical protein
MLIQLQNGKPTGHPVLESNFKQLFPGTSFPAFLTPEDVEPFGFGMYDFTSQPEPGKYQKVVEVEPVKDVQGIYRQTWAVVGMTDEEKSLEDTRMKSEVRQIRNMRLTGSDWTQLADSAADKAAWAAYRQALRDVTGQEGFPWTIDWPEAP